MLVETKTIRDVSNNAFIIVAVAEKLMEDFRPPFYGPDGQICEMFKAPMQIIYPKMVGANYNFQAHARKRLEQDRRDWMKRNKWEIARRIAEELSKC